MHDLAPRPPLFSGRFYPEEPEALTRYLVNVLRDHAPDDELLIKAQGCFVPHAGYIYSGECAARTFAIIDIPRFVLLLHTKHTPQGYPLAIAPHRAWQTPLGSVPIARALADALHASGPARYDAVAEEGEHAGEVILPFLRVLRPDVSVCVVSVAHLEKDHARLLGLAAANACREVGESDVLILASTDMNHYESHARTEKLDDLALEQIEAMNPDGLLDAVREHGISMCGAAATAAMLHACIELGCKTAEVVHHTDSAETSGDYDHVVGYASGYVI